MGKLVFYVLYSWGNIMKVQRGWHASMDCTKEKINACGSSWKSLEAQPRESLRRREGNSEIARNTLRMCKLDLTDSQFCRTVLNLRGSTTRVFTIFHRKLRGSYLLVSSKR